RLTVDDVVRFLHGGGVPFRGTGFGESILTNRLHRRFQPSTNSGTRSAVDLDSLDDWLRNAQVPGRRVGIPRSDPHRTYHAILDAAEKTSEGLRKMAALAKPADRINYYKSWYDNSVVTWAFLYRAATSTRAYENEARAFVLEMAADFADIGVKAGYQDDDWSALAMLIVDEFEEFRAANKRE
ncbi:MAG TPA: hypothetical protein VN579_00205, partial [Bryobacteraceae bacterium]|nr:hypothetical protein [Bryobacteraceae bacterium]